jgi:hypothetical protein
MSHSLGRIEPPRPFDPPPPCPACTGFVWVQIPQSDPWLNAQHVPPSVYDFAPGQAYMLKLYDCYRVALIGRKYHGTKKAW